MKGSLIKMATLATLLVAMTAFAGNSLDKVVKGDHRSEDNKARDQYRKPAEVLEFLGLKPNMTVVEIFPGRGWYTEILAPYLKDKGKLIAVGYDRNPETQQKWMKGANKRFDDKIAGKEALFGNIQLGEAAPPNKVVISDANTVDMILDFRNAHNWVRMGADAMVKEWHKVLKKGGTVGIVDHRMDEDKPYNERNGYIHEKTVIEIMERHGFKLVAKSEILANPKDTKDHPKGVWTLPPSMANKDVDADKYKAIGESDRMLLKFVKN